MITAPFGLKVCMKIATGAQAESLFAYLAAMMTRSKLARKDLDVAAQSGHPGVSANEVDVWPMKQPMLLMPTCHVLFSFRL
ncbi:hypothetical protein HanRHA438_Chr16g0770921 [Helianthus annuus]|nr:hypothetical protein HanRHA438_Chr16g0770921 [Helianthus annuus]